MQSERYTLHHGDALDVLRTLPDASVDAVVTDPPYDVRTHEKSRERGVRPTVIDFAPLSDFGFVSELLRVSRGWVLCFCALEQLGAYQQAAGAAWVRAGVWRRTNPMPQISGDRPGQAAEGIAIMHGPGRKAWNGGGTAGYWEGSVVHKDRVHPTQKPVGLMQRLLVAFLPEHGLVLDPFAGSGTTGVAALRLGMRFIGVEREASYVEIARKRLEAETAQGALFGGAA